MTTSIKTERGFSLIESVVALFVVTIGLLSLAAVLTHAMKQVTSSSGEQLAKDKAYELLESIVAARETRLLTWDQLKNAAQGGRFLDGVNQVQNAGPDNIVGTQDDTGTASYTEPGPDQAFGTADDRTIPLTGYTREIVITNVSPPGAPDTLRQVVVTVRYKAAGYSRSYSLTTLVSSYS